MPDDLRLAELEEKERKTHQQLARMILGVTDRGVLEAARALHAEAVEALRAYRARL